MRGSTPASPLQASAGGYGMVSPPSSLTWVQARPTFPPLTATQPPVRLPHVAPNVSMVRVAVPETVGPKS